MGKKYIVEEVDEGSGCLSVIGLIALIALALVVCAALSK